MRQVQIYRKFLAAMSLLIGLCVLTNAQQAAATPTPDEIRTGIISGRVVNESGQPLIGAAVFIRPAGAATTGRTTTSNLDGNFQVTGLDNALYYVSANSPAYVSPPLEVDTPAPAYRVGDTVKLELIRGGVITGTVTNSLGEPVVGVRVRTFMVRDASGKGTKGSVFSFGERTTDDRGIYRIYGVSPGTYLVQAGGGGQQQNANATDFDAPTFAPFSTRDTASEVQVRSGEESTVDIRYRGESGHSVSGTVKTQGTTGSSVSLTYVGDGILPSNGSYQAPGARGFVIYGLADGEYNITAQEIVSPGRTPFPDIALSDPLRVTIRGADVTGLELVPKPLASISGRVALELSKLPDCQNKRQPLFSETMITLVVNRKETEIDQSALMRSFLGSVSPDKDGVFTLKNVRHGQYSFLPRFFGRYWYLKSISLISTPSTGSSTKQSTAPLKDAAKTWTAVKAGDRITGLTITLTEGAASVRGLVVVPEEMKLEPGLRVYLVPAERDKSDDALRYFTGDLNVDGTFAINNLPPGRYLALALRPPADNASLTEKLRLPDAAETRTKIRRAAELAKTEVELKPCQNLIDYKLIHKPE
jgi:hypothetical protein